LSKLELLGNFRTKGKIIMPKQSATAILLLSLSCLAMTLLPDKTTQIKGKITNSQTELAVSGAAVKLYNSAGRLKAQAKTDSSGAYLLKVKLPRSSNHYKLTVSHSDYNSQSLSRSLTGGKDYVINFSLSPKPKPNQPPVISSLTPADGSIFLASAKITIKVVASDPDKDNLQYRFSIGGTIKQDWSTADTYTWQTQTSDTGAVGITCEVKDTKAATAAKTIAYSIINPTVQDILKKVADNYGLIYDLKADMTLSSTLNGNPFGETQYCRYYFKAPNKEKTETYSNATRSLKTDIIIINGSTMHLVNPIDKIKQQVDLLADANINSSQFNQMDIYYNQKNFLSGHTVTRNNTNTDFNNMIIALDALPNSPNNLYSKLELYIDYNKGLLVKSCLYKENENKQLELMQTIESEENRQMPNGAWIPVKMKKNPNLTAGILISNLTYTNYQINTGLRDYDFDPERQY